MSREARALWLSSIAKGATAGRNALPTLEDEATVVVVGNPKASKAELYFLAASVGFSLVRRYDILAEEFLPAGMIICEYDAASNAVSFTVKYTTCLTTSTWAVGWDEIRQIPVYGGPKNTVVGASWNFISAVTGTPSDPASAGEWKPLTTMADPNGTGGHLTRTRRAPAMPFAGRTILTTSNTCPNPNPTVAISVAVPLLNGSVEVPIPNTTVPTPNPRPAVDFRGRSTAINLVYSALTGPTGLGRKTFPEPIDPYIYKGG